MAIDESIQYCSQMVQNGLEKCFNVLRIKRKIVSFVLKQMTYKSR